MAGRTKQLRSQRRAKATSNAVEPVVDTAVETTISPQDFYRGLTQRDDVRRILTRLAQVADDRA